MLEIIPSLLVESQNEFEEKLRLIENDCNTVQIDILDGSLFPNTTWFDARAIGALNTDVEYELHLMVENPIPIIEQFKEHVPKFKRAIVHAEMHRPTGAVVGHIKDILGLKVGVAINPETPLREIEDVLHSIDELLIMSVHPGYSGQEFGDEGHVGNQDVIFEKIEQARAHREDLLIGIDGGITEDLIEPLARSGANLIGANSLIFKSDDPTKKLQELNKRLASLNI